MTFKSIVKKAKHIFCFTLHLHVVPFLGAPITASKTCLVNSARWLRKTVEGVVLHYYLFSKESEVRGAEKFFIQGLFNFGPLQLSNQLPSNTSSINRPSKILYYFSLYSRSVFVDRFEEVLHIIYGEKDYWEV